MKRINSVFDKLKSTPVAAILSLFLIASCAVTAIAAKSLYPVLIGLAALILALAILWIYAALSTKKRAGETDAVAMINAATLEFLMNLSMPSAILTGRGEILWYNKAFAAASGQTEPLYHRSVADLVADGRISLRRLREDSPEELGQNPVPATLAGTDYEITSYRLSADRIVTLWASLEAVSRLRRALRDHNPVVAYVAVDSFSDSQTFLQGNYRTLAAEISVELKKWASSVNAILREADNNRYLLVMEEAYLQEIRDKRFEILDRVRDLSTGESDEVPVTISIGVACIDGTLEEKDLTARRALELAMQRGGDQAVVKSRENAVEYFGGRTKTVLKQNTIRSRIVAAEVMNLVKKASNVLIMGHRYPDHDSIGSCLGMARFARAFCDRVNVVVNVRDTNLRGVFLKLKGLEDYRNFFVDGAAAQDLVTSRTLLIITDVNNVKAFEAPELFENVQTTVIIDHHRQSAEFAVKPRITYIEPSASSASELVSEMLEQQLPGSLLKEEAEILFAGILLDTKQFSKNTGPRTFSAAHFLREAGADPAEALMLFRTDLEDFKRELKYEANAFIYRDIIAFSYIDENATQEDKIAASKAADRLLNLEKVLASFVLCRMDHVVHISARSSGTVNVQLITEKIGGGGHFDMAGAQVKDATIKETFIRLKEAIDEYLNEA